MVIFGVKLERKLEALKFMAESNERLALKGDIGKNPFFGSIQCIFDSKGFYFIVDMEPIYPRAYIGGLFIIIPALLLNNFKYTWWWIPGFGLLSLGFFWSRFFYYWVMRTGLKKTYRGEIELLSNSELLKILLL